MSARNTSVGGRGGTACGDGAACGGAGFVLVEVLVAIILLAVLIVPLATGMTSAIGRAATVREQTAALTAGTSDSPSGAAWDWGPMVASLVWESGPSAESPAWVGAVARVKVEGRGDPGLTVGLWMDGWFQGEWDVDEGGIVEVVAGELSAGLGLAAPGAELTVRVREPGRSWGPPWRALVPADGSSATPPTAVWHDPVPSDGALTGADNVVHVPALANPAVKISRADVPLEREPLGLPLSVPTLGEGVCDINLGDLPGGDLGGCVQSWHMEEERALDVYY
jgi:hypothetical protein